MLRVKHIENTSKTVILQFRDYKTDAHKIEIGEDQKINKTIANYIGSWLCKFERPFPINNKPIRETAFIKNKKKIVGEFKKFIMSDFPSQIDKENKEKIALIESTNLIINDINKNIHELRKAIDKIDILKINTLINDTFLALTILQKKITPGS